MKVFISADIEGCAGTTFREETHKNEAVYTKFAEQMTREVIAACEGAIEAGATEVVVKDAHGDGSNIDIMKMPRKVKLIRGKSGHPYNMMFGLDESFDAVMYIGYHAGAGNGGSPLSHTSTGNTNYIKINGKYTSEFLVNSYTASMNNVPVVFISGDESICESAKEICKEITTVATKKGIGASTINLSPNEVVDLIRENVKKALSKDLRKCKVSIPQEFEYIVNYKDLKQAYKMSFYPGMEKVDERTNKLVTKSFIDIITAQGFVL